MRKVDYKEKGITLIALVVTIIILLILAGVTLTTALGQNGLFQRAKYAGEKYKESETDETEKLGEVEKEIDKIIDGKTPDPPKKPDPVKVTEENIKEFQGKYVDIGIDTNENKKVDDWEIFYVGNGRIFLIATDYIPVAKLTEWGIIGTDENDGFTKRERKYSVFWQEGKLNFKTLPTEPADFLSLVMHTRYDLNSNNGYLNSKAVSDLLDTTRWNGIKEAATKKDRIDFVIGGSTLEMWCAAWNKAVAGDSNGFVEITPELDMGVSGYGVSSANEKRQVRLYMDGTTDGLSSEQLSALNTNYRTFFPHVGNGSYDNCYGYWLASPCVYGSYQVCMIYGAGDVGSEAYYFSTTGVRPVAALTSDVQIVEIESGTGIFEIVE